MIWLLAFLRYPLGPNWARNPAFVASPSSLFHVSTKGFNPARELSRIGHEKQRAHIRSVARQIREEKGLPPDTRLAG